MKQTMPRHVDDDLKAYLDGELGTVRRMQVTRHLAACPTCREKELEMKRISQQLKGWGAADSTISPDLRANLLSQAPQGRDTDGPVQRPLWRRSPGLVFGGGGLTLAASLAAFATLYSTANHAPEMTATTEAVAVASPGQTVADTQTEGVAVAAGAAPAAGAVAPVMDAAKAPAMSNGAEYKGQVLLRSPQGMAYRSRSVDKLTSPPSAHGKIVAADADSASEAYSLDTRQVHREASLGVAVDNPEAASAKVEMQVKEWGGYVASNVLNTDDSGYKSADLTLKVPEERFDELLASVSKIGDVRFKNITGEDITEQNSDATSDEQVIRDQIATLEARLKAGSLSERRTVQAEAQLRQTQRDLVRTQARLGLLRKLARLSTLSVTLTEKKKAEATAVAPATGFWADMKDSNRSALHAFQAAVRVPLLLAIWLVALSPIWLPLALVYRHLARKQAASQLVEQATPPVEER